jgi:TolB protein
MIGFFISAFFLSQTLYGATPVVIDINKPSFRKIIGAVPNFDVPGGREKDLGGWSQEASQYMRELMTFSGMFHLLPFDVYNGMEKSTLLKVKTPGTIPGFEAMDLPSWKVLGVESLTLGSLTQEGQTVSLTLQTGDLMQGRRVFGATYGVKDLAHMKQLIRQYLDRLLEAYTGKPGIFSTRIAFVGRRSPKEEKQIFLCDIDGKNLEQLTFENTTHLAPAWNPDGKSILYTSYEAKNPDLYRLDLGTRKKTKVAAYRGINSGATFSPNGKVLVYSGSVKGNTELFYTHPNAIQTRVSLVSSHGIEVDPDFSPDGQWISFVSDRFGNPHIFRGRVIWNATMDRPRVEDQKRLTYAGWYNATPAWSKDSQKIAFAGYDRDINRFDLFMMNSDGTALERLTLKSGDNESPTWSPNGELIMFQSSRVGQSDVKGPTKLYLMNRDGTSQRVVETGLYEAQTPKWGPVAP